MSNNSGFSLSGEIVIGPVPFNKELVFDLNQDQNPGLGGTEFYSLRLAGLLHSFGFRVTLLTQGARVRFTNGHIHVVSFSEASRSGSLLHLPHIANAATARIHFDYFKSVANLVLVSHHPHDGDLRYFLRKSDPIAVVSLGEYQYLSNRCKQIPHYWIPALTQKPLEIPGPFERTDTVGHISSMHPSKGFHLVAKAWVRIFEKVSTRLEVIGGVSLYGMEEGNSFFHTSSKYGDKLDAIFCNSNSLNRVDFRGRLSGDLDKHIGLWKFAILNPRGTAEADPTSVKECLRLGVPVVGGFDFGMRQYLKFFPETLIRSSRKLDKKILELLGNPDLLNELSQRALSTYDLLYQRNIKVQKMWKELLLKISVPTQFGSSHEEVFREFVPQENGLVKVRIFFRSFLLFPVLRFAQDLQGYVALKKENSRPKNR